MTLPKAIGAYLDVQPILDAAVLHNGGEYRLPSPGKATRWRQRAYQFRRLTQKLTPDSPTKYDHLILTLDGPLVRISIASTEGVFTTPTGQTITPIADSQRAMENKFERDAQDLARRLLGGPDNEPAAELDPDIPV